MDSGLLFEKKINVKVPKPMFAKMVAKRFEKCFFFHLVQKKHIKLA